ncbi:MAG: DNA-directed RNA polymerase subunit alpha, partial [Syntrophothermus sp.]
MAILPFQKPDKVIMVEADDKKGIFEFRPLEPGFGITIGNALRRILLSSLEGYAITSVKIEGVDQEFSTIKGVIEDVTEILLNLKQIRFKRQIETESSEKVTVIVGQQTVFKAGDINKFLSVFQVLNPEVVICHMEPGVKLSVELSIDKGRGYVPAEENKTLNPTAVLGRIPIDSIHTPIRNVKFHVENYRVEQKTDYEKLILDVETDGSIHPKNALKEAAKILIHHFMLFSDEKITLDTTEKAVAEEFDETSLHIRQLLKTKLVDMDLSVRALNCLKA